MSAVAAWLGPTMVATTALMLLVFALRGPARRWLGPRLAYALWALPALRCVAPTLPVDGLAALPVVGGAAVRMSVLFVGPAGAAAASPVPPLGSAVLPAIWLGGALTLFAIYVFRHVAFCRRLQRGAVDCGAVGTIRVLAADVDGPLAFGVVRPAIAVPRDFASTYDVSERALALSHEQAHHRRGDLVANWASLVVLAAHWWNPVAWFAIAAFRHEQELAADAHVVAGKAPDIRAHYARVLAKAAGIGALPVCNLNPRADLKGRLMMLAQPSRSRRRLIVGGAALALLGGGAFAATVAKPVVRPAAGTQATSIGVKPDGSGGYMLIVGGRAVASGGRLPGGATLPADLDPAGGCDLKPAAKPRAMVIKGMGRTKTYTVMCASAAPANVRATLAEGLASLGRMRASVATQPASAVFPEAERAHALGAIDRSIAEVEATLAAAG